MCGARSECVLGGVRPGLGTLSSGHGDFQLRSFEEVIEQLRGDNAQTDTVALKCFGGELTHRVAAEREVVARAPLALTRSISACARSL